MNTAIPHPLTFNRVTLHLSRATSPPQHPPWRWRVTDALSRISCYPTLPPQAILVVRHLSDPLPEGLLSDRPFYSLHPWEQQLQAQINDCWRTAIRVAHSPVPPAANAVWFADSAEWLACLSWDIHQGIATQRWWWQTWMRKYSSVGASETLVRLWQADVQWLPQTLTLLYQRHGTGLSPLLARLSSGQAQVLRQEVAQAYALPPMETSQIVQKLRPMLPLAAQNLMQGLPEENQALVALGLEIVLVPSGIQQLTRKEENNSQFTIQEAETVTNLSDADLAKTEQAEKPIEGTTFNAELSADQGQPFAGSESCLEPNLPGETVGVPTHPEDAPYVRIGSVKQAATDSEPEQSPREISPQNLGELGSQSAQECEDFDGQAGTQLNRVIPHTHPSLSEEAVLTPTIANKSSDSLILAAELGVSTDLGGIWYLVNVLADLDWLVDNTVLNGWHKLLTLAQALLPEALPDELWAILTELAGEAIPEAECQVWLAGALPSLKDYLTARFEPPDDLQPLIADILQEPATLYVTRTHIDVVFTLDQIRLDVRIAGLDRDPGWVPELARVIAFHYE